MADEFKRMTNKACCPGGWNCRHCGITPGKDRDAERRRARRSLKVADRMHVRYGLTREYLHPAEMWVYRYGDLDGIA